MTYNDRVFRKMSDEYNAFVENLKTLPGEKAIEYAYEKVLKEDILCFFENDSCHLSQQQAKALLALKEPLDALYREWLHADYSYMDILKDCVDDSIRTIETRFEAINHRPNKSREHER